MTQTEQHLSDLRRQVAQARAVPMSASCMVNRDETLALIDRISHDLAADLQQYAANYAGGDAARGQEIIAQAQAQAAQIISQTEIARGAEMQAAQILARARAESEELLIEADRYVETRLAAFEAELQVTMSRVSQMRERLLDRSQLAGPADQSEVLGWPTPWDE